jgi:hypothetical protein
MLKPGDCQTRALVLRLVLLTVAAWSVIRIERDQGASIGMWDLRSSRFLGDAKELRQVKTRANLDHERLMEGTVSITGPAMAPHRPDREQFPTSLSRNASN